MSYYHSKAFRGEDNFDQKLMTKDCQFNCYRSNISPSYMGDLMADLRKVTWYCMQKIFHLLENVSATVQHFGRYWLYKSDLGQNRPGAL